MGVWAVSPVAFALLSVNHAFSPLIWGMFEAAAIPFRTEAALAPGFAVFIEDFLASFRVVGLQFLKRERPVLDWAFALPQCYEAEAIARVVWAHATLAPFEAFRHFVVE